MATGIRGIGALPDPGVGQCRARGELRLRRVATGGNGRCQRDTL